MPIRIQRTAMPIHHTDTATGEWDGDAMRARLKTGDSEAYYRSAFAWQDPEKDAATKDAYSFLHHEVTAQGDIGAANMAACRSAIGVLNGARLEEGDETPWMSDREGIHRHMAAHMQDGGMEPPDLMMRGGSGGREVRSIRPAELRVPGEGAEPRKLVGHAALFGSISEVLSSWFDEFREVILPGAFTRTIQTSDVRSLWNHDPNIILGRTASGTLMLREDDLGLWQETTLPDNPLIHNMVLAPIDRGDVTQMSFAFQVRSDRWRVQDGMDLREIIEVDPLYDVSPVVYPAYPATDVSARADWVAAGIPAELRDLGRAISRARRQLPMLPADRQLLRRTVALLREAQEQEEASPPAWRLRMLRRRLEVVTLMSP